MASSENSDSNKEARIKQYKKYIEMVWKEPSYSESIKKCNFNPQETVDTVIKKLKYADIDNPYIFFSLFGSLIHFLEKTCEKT